MHNALLMLPDFGLILLGALLARRLGFRRDFWDGAERLVYYALFPPLLFISIVNARFSLASEGRMLAAAVGAFLAAVALGFASRWIFRPQAAFFASCVQTAFRYNSYVGLALAQSLAGSRGVALTNDGGQTWVYREDNPVLLDAWYEGDRVWGIEQTIGEPQISVYRVDADLRLVPERGAKPDQPCDAADGEPQHLAFWSDTKGLLLCQNAVTGSRLLARTTNAGVIFERRPAAPPGP